MRLIIFITFLGWTSFALSQWNLPIKLVFGNQPVEINKNYSINNEIVNLAKVRFYIMDLHCYSNGTEMNMSSTAILIDAEIENSIQLEGKEPQTIDSISFLFGTSNEVNENLVLEGPLDPINGMYWAWNSGYINLKIEGNLITENVNHPFTYHLGGYQKEFPTAQKILLIPKNKQLQLTIDFEKIVKVLINQPDFELMIPGIKAAELSQLMANELMK